MGDWGTSIRQTTFRVRRPIGGELGTDDSMDVELEYPRRPTTHRGLA